MKLIALAAIAGIGLALTAGHFDYTAHYADGVLRAEASGEESKPPGDQTRRHPYPRN